MNNVDRLRDRAIRLLAMADSAREYREFEFAERLAARAIQFLDDAMATLEAETRIQRTLQRLQKNR